MKKPIVVLSLKKQRKNLKQHRITMSTCAGSGGGGGCSSCTYR
ncbi:MAG: hypothetical protein PHR00_04615 [Patescibacteria group bacterium]|nr:hypothetical protein [Patescibacteria group bacterium]